MTEKRIVVIGGSYSGRLGIIRSAAAMGYKATIVALVPYKKDLKTLNKAPQIDAYSKYVDQIFYCHFHDEKAIIKILLEHCSCQGYKPVVFPDSDIAASTLDQHYNELKDHFLLPNIHHEQGAVTHWMDKERQKALAKEVGLNVAHSVRIAVANKAFTIPDDIAYPCFVKPAQSIGGNKSMMKRCASRSELHRQLLIIGQECDTEVMIEDYMDISDEYALLGFSDGETVTIPGILHILKLSHGSSFGVAMTGEIMPCNGFETLVEQFKNFVVKIGYVGVFDIDFYRCHDKLYFGELNMRFGGSGYAYTKMGVNMPAMMIRHLSGKDWREMEADITSTATYANDRMLLYEWSNGYISTKEYRRIKEQVDFTFVYDDDDTGPLKQFNKVFPLFYIKHLAKKILHRI